MLKSSNDEIYSVAGAHACYLLADLQTSSSSSIMSKKEIRLLGGDFSRGKTISIAALQANEIWTQTQGKSMIALSQTYKLQYAKLLAEHGLYVHKSSIYLFQLFHFLSTSLFLYLFQIRQSIFICTEYFKNDGKIGSGRISEWCSQPV